MTVSVAFEVLAEIARVYAGSDGDATKALYARLEQLGPRGVVALNLFRAQKNSERAKVYRGGGYRGAAYDRKQWAMDNLCTVLGAEAEALNIRWGWGRDEKAVNFENVLYVYLPEGIGQVSFHTHQRGAGPDFAGDWDGAKGKSPERILRFCAWVLQGEARAASADQQDILQVGG